MLIKAKDLKRVTLYTLDGKIGWPMGFYFDDQHWTVRYLIADTGDWLKERKILISPYALDAVKKDATRMVVHLTRKQIQDSPSLAIGKPVSKHFEDAFYTYYGWPRYWTGPYIWGASTFIERDPQKQVKPAQVETPWVPHLRNGSDVTGYRIQAKDDEIGYVDDFIIDDETWMIRYLIIDTKDGWTGEKVLISPQWIEHISWNESNVFVNLTCETIRQSPRYTDESLLVRDYGPELHQHYNRHGYWDNGQLRKGMSRQS